MIREELSKEIAETAYKETMVFLEMFKALLLKETLYGTARSIGSDIARIIMNTPTLKIVFGPNRPADQELCADFLHVDIISVIHRSIEASEGMRRIMDPLMKAELERTLSRRIAQKLVENPKIIGFAACYVAGH